MRREYIFLIIGIILAIIVTFSLLIFSSSKGPKVLVGSPSPSISIPTRYPISSVKPDFSPPKQADLPFIPQNQGGGIDTQSEAVKQSVVEINKLVPFLSHQESLVLSTGEKVQISIPSKNLQLNAWTLTVQIFNIDYQVEKQTPEYEVMKASFIEAANRVFDWMKTKGANPDKIIISWGDRAFIQERAEEWLAQ
jgi:hypothetical protein